VAFLIPVGALAQTICDENAGPMTFAQPRGMTPQGIIQKFSANEDNFKQAWEDYAHVEEFSIQTLTGNSVDGEYREVAEIAPGIAGQQVRKVILAPPSSLSRLVITKQNLDDIRERMSFVLTTKNLPQYDVRYVGAERVDEIDTYVFDVAPKATDNGEIRFKGRVWVDDRGLQIIKTCGSNLSVSRTKKTNQPSPKFVTYREQIDGQYWFATYSRAEDLIHASGGDVKVREIVKYTKYNRH
jgi:hypothetical protein